MLESIVSWSLVFLIFILGGTFCYRIYLSISLTSEEKSESTTSSNLRRIRRTKKKTLEKNVQIILWSGIGMVAVNLVIMYLFIGYQEEIKEINNENIKIRETVQQLKIEQTQWIQASGYNSYPKEGIKFDNKEWNEVNSKNGSKILKEIELSIGSQLQPFIGLNTVLITNEESKESLKITIRSEENKEIKDQLQKTVEGIVKNLEEVKIIKEVEFQFVDQDEKVSTSYSYLREKEEQPFEIHENVNEKPEDKK